MWYTMKPPCNTLAACSAGRWEEQLHGLEGLRRLLRRVEAVHAASWLWHSSGVPAIRRASESSRRANITSTSLRKMLPALRRRAKRRRGVLLQALFRSSVLRQCCGLVFGHLVYSYAFVRPGTLHEAKRFSLLLELMLSLAADDATLCTPQPFSSSFFTSRRSWVVCGPSFRAAGGREVDPCLVAASSVLPKHLPHFFRTSKGATDSSRPNDRTSARCADSSWCPNPPSFLFRFSSGSATEGAESDASGRPVALPVGGEARKLTRGALHETRERLFTPWTWQMFHAEEAMQHIHS